MIDFVHAIHSSAPWVFIVLGCILLIAELLGTGGYTLWSGISAIIVGVISMIIPFSWSTLWILFAIFTLFSAYFWSKWLKKADKQKDINEALNQPQKALIGIETVVVEPFINGTGRVKIKDGTWPAKCDHDLAVGEWVKVIEVNGLVLTVVKIDS